MHVYYEVKNYYNEGQLAYGDYYCDPWGNACDPIFYICFESEWKECDIHYRQESYYYNVWGFLSHVGSGSFTLREKKLKYVRIHVVDYDSLGSSDYIGTYYIDFRNIVFPYKRLKYVTRHDGPVISLAVKYDVSCLTNYYGVNCKIFCAKSDTYNCTSNGTKICKTNFYGSDCIKYCEKNNLYNCSSNGDKICKTNYYGSDCRRYCANTTSYICDLNGDKVCKLSCGINEKCFWLSESNEFTCGCRPGYLGNPCHHPDFSGSNKLQNSSLSENQQRNITVIHKYEFKSNIICSLCKPYEHCIWINEFNQFKCVCKTGYLCGVTEMPILNETLSNDLNATYAHIQLSGLSGSILGILCFFVILLISGIGIGVLFGLWYRNKQVFDVFVVWRRKNGEVTRVDLNTNNV